MDNEESVEAAYLSWDTLDIAMKRAAELLADGDITDENEAFQDACADSLLHQDAWDCLTRALTELMIEVNPESSPWLVKYTGVGWRKSTGHAVVEADNGQDLLHGVLPKTDCTFHIYKEDDHIRIVNSHHDAMGEVYDIHAPPTRVDAKLRT